ncbi:DUF2846 domain-containing protein [Acinetobacter guillouiae]|jgi:hypothetical protein|uniref:DUF2846 domain-containing protein n=1 Tax=Acinetobacter guillouiae TaxID=106649 RepID=UPI0026E262C2|nr:DUF2846 domain-containing protein [Acinetobacter guillouiae]MDO6643594.1 DUF2846 domain-containing protein [Acinetobacter guillouiae]
MRYIGLVVLISCGLAACQSHQSVEQQPAKVVSTLDPIDFKKEDSLVHEKLEQYKVASFSTGSWVNQKPGQYFKLVKPQNPQAAIVYFYRPDSRWNRQEIIPNNFFLNGKKIPSLISNHYYWIELAEGDYKLSLSRPLTIFHFQKPKVAYFSVEAGGQYFVKYEEEKFRGGPNGEAGLLRVGPLMQMPTRQGLKEIAMTQLKTPGLNFVAEVTADGRVIKPKEKIKGEPYKVSDDVHLGQQFKLWNPMTW